MPKLPKWVWWVFGFSVAFVGLVISVSIYHSISVAPDFQTGLINILQFVLMSFFVYMLPLIAFAYLVYKNKKVWFLAPIFLVLWIPYSILVASLFGFQ